VKQDIDMRELGYLLAYTAPQAWYSEWYEGMIARHQRRGYDVEGFCVTLNPPGPRLNYPELDRRWKERDPWLLQLYERLENRLRERDVFILFNGANIHEDFVKRLSTFNVYICWDDPESSELLSKPVAKYFDFAFTGNIACVNLYRSWEVQNVDFLPFGCPDSDRDLTLNKDQILQGDRDIDLVLLCERRSLWRRERLDALRKAFPQALMRGHGWPEGFLSFEQTTPTYMRSKIGWNVHNSVGPVNRRTYMLPANGVMQICDNKTLFGHLFKLGEEGIGFDGIEECVELTHYYLAHDDERRRIAAQGWERATTEYSEEKVWERLVTTIQPHYVTYRSETPASYQIVRNVTNSIKEGRHIITSSIRPSNLKRVPLGIARRTHALAKRTCRASLSRLEEEKETDEPVQSYIENKPMEGINWAQRRLKEGKPFEWPNMTALNQTVAGLLGPHKRIIEIGSGTGCFAYEAAQDPLRSIFCIEPDPEALAYARTHRSRPNISYEQARFTELNGRYELVVAIDVIEHIDDYRRFLEKCVELAPCAILTTPNKNRSPESAVASPPNYPLHVREWTAGEFYWVLRVFYQQVCLFAMPNPYIPMCVPITVTSTMHPLIAVCEGGKE
jgi:spore maturation protein CgeB